MCTLSVEDRGVAVARLRQEPYGPESVKYRRLNYLRQLALWRSYLS
jgi:hypothetical protein